MILRINKSLAGALFAIAIATTASAAPTLTSPYGGQNPGNANGQYGVIGNLSQFDIDSITFTNISSSSITVQLDLNYNRGDATLSSFTVGTLTVSAADLLFSSGNQFWGVALKNHAGFTAGDLYTVDSFRTAKDVLGNPPTNYNTNSLVWLNNDGHQSQVGLGTSSSKNIGFDEIQTTLNFVPTAGLYQAFNKGVYVQFASATCGNDYLAGTVTSAVPEPAGFALLGSGLVGLGLLSKLRRKSAGR